MSKKRGTPHRTKTRWYAIVGFIVFLFALSRPRDVGIIVGLALLVGALGLIGWAAWRIRGWFRRRIDENAPGPDEEPSFPTPPAFIPLHSPASIPTIGDVLALTAGQFEELTRDLLAALGFQGMTRTGGAGDLGVDVNGRDRQGRTVVVQCKRFAPGNQVGSPVVQSFIGMMTVQHRAERGVFVTSSIFSQPAIDLARAHGVTLIDGAALLTLLALTGIGGPAPTIVPMSAPSFAIPSLSLAPTPAGPSSNGRAPLHSPRFCTNCGLGIDDAEAFCPNCGQKIKRTMQREPA